MHTKQKHPERLEYTPQFCVLFLGFSVAVLFLSVGFYLASTNALAVQGNATHRGEKEREMLSKEYRKLQIEAAELSSLHRVRERGEGFASVSAEEVLHIAAMSELALQKQGR